MGNRRLPARRSVVIAVAVVVLLGVGGWLLATALGGGDEPEPLAITNVEWSDPTHLFAYVGCATLDDVQVDHGGELTEVTITGVRRDGGCQEWALVSVEEGATEILDGTTGERIELPTYLPGTGGHG